MTAATRKVRSDLGMENEGEVSPLSDRGQSEPSLRFSGVEMGVGGRIFLYTNFYLPLSVVLSLYHDCCTLQLPLHITVAIVGRHQHLM